MRLLPLAALALLALPAAAALPVACADECRIASSSLGYDPLVAFLASGASVVWSSSDITHVTREATVGSATEECFEVAHAKGADSSAVRLDIQDGALFATVDGDTRRCTSAVGSEQGGFALHYFCTLHPTMRAALVVTG